MVDCVIFISSGPMNQVNKLQVDKSVNFIHKQLIFSGNCADNVPIQGEIMSYKVKLEEMGYIIREEIQYWSLEHAEKGIYLTGSGQIEELCKSWFKFLEEKREKVSA